VLFLTLTGARVQEACDLRHPDVSLARAEVILRHTKNGSSRRVKLAPVLMQALEMLLAEDGAPEDRVLGYGSRWSVNTAIRRACARAKIPYLSSHIVGRHAFAARLLGEGHSLRLVQEAGAWRTARMVSDHYGHLERSHVDNAVVGVATAALALPSRVPPDGARDAR
jgi:integrase